MVIAEVTHIALDVRTLSFVLTIIAALIAGVMAFVWRTQQTYPGFGYWALGNFAASIGFFLLGLRGYGPDLLTIVLANVLITACMAIAYEGTRRFIGLNNRFYLTLTLLALETMAIVYFTFVSPNLTNRIISASVLIGFFCVMSGYAFSIPHNLGSAAIYRIASGTHWIMAVILFMRAALTAFVPEPADLYSPQWIQSASFMLFIVFAIFWGFVYIVINGERMEKELRSAESKLQRLANTDGLTGLLNKRRFCELVSEEVIRSRRYGEPLSLIIFDLDRFKEINDRHGHAAGDKVLADVAAACKRRMRSNDILGRLGGEEFGIALPHTELDGAAKLAEEVRSIIENIFIDFMGEPIQLTASFGVALLRKNDTYSTVIRRADGLLYDAKYNGRNSVISELDKPPMYLVSGIRVRQ